MYLAESPSSTPATPAAAAAQPALAAGAGTHAPSHAPSHAAIWTALVKARLSALVLATAAVGFAVAPRADDGAFPWETFAWMCLGTALAAGSAAMLNQLMETHRDARMHRTARRPLPAGHARPVTVFIVGVLTAYAGCAVLASFVNVLSASLALANILIYVLLYTPLKSRTTFNTLVGAVTGAVPPLIGWAGAAGTLTTGAWALFAILFVWQIPHFLALAWMYREDYERGGFAMLPSLDPQGHATSQACIITSLMLVPVGLLATMTGVAGFAYAVAAVVLGVGMSVLAFRFWRTRSNATARVLFLASLLYLPALMTVMVLDRGSVVPTSKTTGDAITIQVPGSTP